MNIDIRKRKEEEDPNTRRHEIENERSIVSVPLIAKTALQPTKLAYQRRGSTSSEAKISSLTSNIG
jgi:hypothetical protein